MGDSENIASLEAKVEAHDELFRLTHHELHQLHGELEKLREQNGTGLAELREHTDRGLAELREHTDRGLADLRDHTDRGLADLRDHTDRGLAGLRAHTDRGLAELREHTDRGFAEVRQSIEELRREQAKMNRWLLGITLTYGTAIVAMLARMAGLF